MLEVMLTPGRPGGRLVCLRELCGRDEGLLPGTSSAAATSLLERLVVASPGTSASSIADLTVCDRDRLLAAVHRATYGDHIETRAPCHACGVPFELAFSLSALEADLTARASAALPGPDGTYRLPDGRRFRLPTLADERALIGLSPATAACTLAARCLLDGEPDDPGAILTAVERAGPLLDLELSTTCPECQAEQIVHFDIQSFLLTAILQDVPGLTREVHRIAVAYGWSLTEILELPRSQRRTHVALIEAERPTRKTHA
jgi:hypothetical protein